MSSFQRTLLKMFASLILLLCGTLGIGAVFISTAIIAQNNPSGSLLVDVVEWNMLIPAIVFSGFVGLGLYWLVKSEKNNRGNSSRE